MLRVAVVQSSTGGVAIRYILPVLVDDVMFQLNGLHGALCVFLSGRRIA